MTTRFLASLFSDEFGQELFLTDGTPEETELLKDADPDGEDIDSEFYDFLLLADGRVLFRVDDAPGGAELWVTDGTEVGTHLLKDINPSGSSFPYGMTLLPNGNVVFVAQDESNGFELWVTDGSEAGTVLLKDINPSGNGNPGDLVLLPNGTILFRADDGVHGGALWITDGTAEGTVLLKDINPAGDDSINALTQMSDGRVLFKADDGTYGHELWISDGTAEGTKRVKDINTTGDSRPDDFVSLGNGLAIFNADDGVTRRELWVTDGTEDGTKVIDINASGRSSPGEPASLGNGLALLQADDGTHGDELWVTDGTVEGTKLVKDFNPTGDADFYQFAVLSDGSALFIVDIDGGRELWRSDGTSAGTSLVVDITDDGEAPDFLTVVGNTAYYEVNGQLLVSDGTAKGTVIVEGLKQPEILFELPEWSDADQLFSYAEKQAEGFLIGNVSGSVAGAGNGSITGFIITEGNEDGLFAIDEEGNITLTAAGAAAAANDYETGPNTFVLTIEATGLVSNADPDTVIITVEDVDGITLVGTKKKDLLEGTEEADIGRGKAGKDTLEGFAGDDVLKGNKGRDTLIGDEGADILNGGKQKDKLTGGEGPDSFVFASKLKNNWADKITDFEVGVDTIVLDKAVFKKAGPVGDLKDKFFDTGKKADSGKDRILYHEKSGWLRYDKDGKGGADAVKFAKVDEGLDLSADDFLVI